MFKMVESNFIEDNSFEASNLYPNNQLNKINKDYFIAEIKERKLMSKRLSKFYASFVLSAASGIISIVSFPKAIGAPVGIASASLKLKFSLFTGLVKKLLKTIRNNEKKHKKIVMLARSKLNRIEIKISEALKNNEISHEYFVAIINEDGNYRVLKERIRMTKGQEDKKKIDID